MLFRRREDIVSFQTTARCRKQWQKKSTNLSKTFLLPHFWTRRLPFFRIKLRWNCWWNGDVIITVILYTNIMFILPMISVVLMYLANFRSMLGRISVQYYSFDQSFYPYNSRNFALVRLFKLLSNVNNKLVTMILSNDIIFRLALMSLMSTYTYRCSSKILKWFPTWKRWQLEPGCLWVIVFSFDQQPLHYTWGPTFVWPIFSK